MPGHRVVLVPLPRVIFRKVYAGGTRNRARTRATGVRATSTENKISSRYRAAEEAVSRGPVGLTPGYLSVRTPKKKKEE